MNTACDNDLVQSEQEIERGPWCVLRYPDAYSHDPDIIGPFATFEEAKTWLATYEPDNANCDVRVMQTSKFEQLCREEAAETAVVLRNQKN